MTILKINKFTGMMPIIPAESLPDNAAAYAKNCYFGMGGELRSMWGPGQKYSTQTAARSIFTDNGERFYVWPSYTRAYLSPTIDDFWRRVYFNVESEGTLRLTSTDAIGAKQGMRALNANPGPPSWSLKAGVKPPTSIVATKSQDVDAFFWVQVLHDGVVVKETALLTQPFTEVVEWEQYRVTVDSSLLSFPVPQPSTDPAVPAVIEDFRFFLKLVNKNEGAVRFEGVTPHVDEGAGTFLLTVPSFAAGRAVTIAYVATVVNNVNEESAPTAPVLIDTRDNGMFSTSITVTIAPDPDQIPPQVINVYRTYGTSTTYLLADKVPYIQGQTTYVFSEDSTEPITTAALAENQAEWDQPPEGMHSLTYAGNGIFCAAVGKDLCMSEPYRPHAWPYRMVFPNTITGIIEVENGVLVTTTTKPYFVYGTHPTSMTQQAAATEQAGFSAKSMARVDGMAIYAGYDGLVTAQGGQASAEYSRALFDQYSWRSTGFKSALPKASLCAWDGMLFYVHDDTSQPDWIFSLDSQQPSVVEFDTGSDLTGVGIAKTTDTTYLLYSNGIAANAGGADLALPLVWKSKVFDLPTDAGFGAVVVDGAGAFTFKFYCNYELIHTETAAPLQNEHRFRLPPVRGKKWQVEIAGAGRIRRLEMGSTFAELKNG